MVTVVQPVCVLSAPNCALQNVYKMGNLSYVYFITIKNFYIVKMASFISILPPRKKRKTFVSRGDVPQFRDTVLVKKDKEKTILSIQVSGSKDTQNT